ncbi:hypothetical protein Rsub_00286 [Raphidocelis subcapitata]|uniref:Uncharacterized protein n=1 Tax=Raphidocelis subcapitata TaxID=307507 RepID=A0A2V0NRW7_9CHLO|nr:hypothetical protein Rsub_00286 [Raphidocelis subcapitata]|eukprot:GBF87575.1 hypothetical protein Rsub_00286 [Raphidocelis subcapitata]
MAPRLPVALAVAALLIVVSGVIHAPGFIGGAESGSSGGGPGLRRVARRLAQSLDNGGGRAEPSLLNACGSGLTNVRIEFRSPSGSVRRTRIATVAAGGRRTFSVRAAWPSEGVITGQVEGGGSFSLGFQVGQDGAVSWPSAAAPDGAAATPARDAVVEGAACTLGGATLRGPTTAGASLKAAGAPAAMQAARGAAATTRKEGTVQPTSITAVEPNQIIVRADTVSTYLAEPVEIFILANDNIPDPYGTSIKLFSSGSPRGVITLLSLKDDGGESDDVFFGSDGDIWNWFDGRDGPPDNYTGGAAPPLPDNDGQEVYNFLRWSCITYTPGPFILAGTVQFNYTVGSVTGVVTVVIERRPGDSLNAANDYFRLSPEEPTFEELPILFNDMGPTGLATYWLEIYGNDTTDPDYKSFLSVVGFTQGAFGSVDIVEAEETTSTFTYTVTDPGNGGPRCLVDRFTYAIMDPAWPANRPASATVYLNIFDDPPENWADENPDDPPNYPFAVDDEFEGVGRTEPFVMSGLHFNDVTCAGAAKIAYAGSIDPAAGRVNRNGNTVVWYPPAAGVPDDVEYIEFEYQLALPYVSGDSANEFDGGVGGDYTENVPKLAQSNLAKVTMWFGDGGNNYDYDYTGAGAKGAGAADAAPEGSKRAQRKQKKAERRGIKAVKDAERDRLRVTRRNKGFKKAKPTP